MSPTIKKIAVTGSAGQIAYSLLFRIASGEMLGKEQPIALHLLELPEALQFLEGVKMELDDCAFPLLKEIHLGSDPYQVFKDIDLAILVGAKPRGQGMERQELLESNAKIFVEQGRALDAVAKQSVQVVVVGNPCNTNCLIALKQCKRIPSKQFHAMTRLDQNRASSLLAKKAGASISEVSHVTIWGNHSNTQVPDGYNARISNQTALDKIGDESWLQGEFIEKVQKRGAAVIASRGKSSAASAAQAIMDHVKAIFTPTPKGHWFSMAVFSQGNPYGIDEDLVFSFPCQSQGNGSWEIVKDIPLNNFLKDKIKLSTEELIEERKLAF